MIYTKTSQHHWKQRHERNTFVNIIRTSLMCRHMYLNTSTSTNLILCIQVQKVCTQVSRSIPVQKTTLISIKHSTTAQYYRKRRQKCNLTITAMNMFIKCTVNTCSLSRIRILCKCFKSFPRGFLIYIGPESHADSSKPCSKHASLL